MKLLLSGVVPLLVALVVSVGTWAAVPGPDPDPAQYLANSAITAKIKAKLALEDEAGSLVTIVVDTDSAGGVLLRGTARNRNDADKASVIAQATAGVTSVTNHIEVVSEIARGAR